MTKSVNSLGNKTNSDHGTLEKITPMTLKIYVQYIVMNETVQAIIQSIFSESINLLYILHVNLNIFYSEMYWLL
jgi:hypothetical protein